MIKRFSKNSKYKLLFVFSLTLLVAFLLPMLTTSQIQATAYAEDMTQDEIMDEINDSVNDQLGNLDFSSIEDILSSFDKKAQEIFGGNSFINKIKAIISGDFASDSSNIWQALFSLFFDELLAMLPIISAVIAVSILGGMLQGLRPSTNGKSISNIIHFVTYGIIVVLLLTIVSKMVGMTTSTINSLKSQMDAIFPILLTLLTAVGGSVSVSVYQPAMALLTGTILNFFTYILLPIFIFSTVFSVVSNLSNSIKLDKFTSFFNSTFKWLTGLIFTVFTAFMSIQGITAGAVDGISIRTAKYAIKSYIPILGSYLSDGMSIILASSNLIKNAVGAGGLLLLVATILSPLIQLILFMLVLKLIAGIVEPLGNKQIANFVSSLSKSLVLLIVIIIGVAFIYFIMLGLVMCSANIV
jgi:stage III sporulation protein AE